MNQIGFGSNRKTRHMMPSGHKAFVVNNPSEVDLLLMHNKTYAAEYVSSPLILLWMMEKGQSEGPSYPHADLGG